jgi:formaldehyde-activating enzyme involved in methanogenesis
MPHQAQNAANGRFFVTGSGETEVDEKIVAALRDQVDGLSQQVKNFDPSAIARAVTESIKPVLADVARRQRGNVTVHKFLLPKADDKSHVVNDKHGFKLPAVEA